MVSWGRLPAGGLTNEPGDASAEPAGSVPWPVSLSLAFTSCDAQRTSPEACALCTTWTAASRPTSHPHLEGPRSVRRAAAGLGALQAGRQARVCSQSPFALPPARGPGRLWLPSVRVRPGREGGASCLGWPGAESPTVVSLSRSLVSLGGSRSAPRLGLPSAAAGTGVPTCSPLPGTGCPLVQESPTSRLVLMCGPGSAPSHQRPLCPEP